MHLVLIYIIYFSGMVALLVVDMLFELHAICRSDKAIAVLILARLGQLIHMEVACLVLLPALLGDSGS